MILPYDLSRSEQNCSLIVSKSSSLKRISLPTQILMKCLIEIEEQKTKIKILGKKYSCQIHHPSLSSIIKKIHPYSKKPTKDLLNKLDEMKSWLQKDPKLTEENLTQLLQFVLSRNGFFLQYVPDQYKTVELCLLAVINNPWSLEYVPQFFRTQKICLIAVSGYGCLLQFVPEQHKDYLLCRVAILQDPLALEYVKDSVKMQDRGLCYKAVAKNGLAIRYVPKEWEVKYPSDYLELCHKAVTENSRALQYIDDLWKERHPQLCRLALYQNGWVLAYVPHQLQKCYPDLCELAVTHTGLALSFVLPDLKQYALCKTAIEQNPLALEHVPNEIKIQYPDLCLLAFAKSKWVFQFFPKELKTYECSVEAVRAHGMLLRYVLEENREYFLCATAIAEDPQSIQYVPSQLLYERTDLCRMAVSEDGWMIAYIPEDLKDRWVCLEALLSIVKNSLLKLRGYFANYQELDESFLEDVPADFKEEFSIYYEEVAVKGVSAFYNEKKSLIFPKCTKEESLL